jgi:hypothetical protein
MSIESNWVSTCENIFSDILDDVAFDLKTYFLFKTTQLQIGFFKEKLLQVTMLVKKRLLQRKIAK